MTFDGETPSDESDVTAEAVESVETSEDTVDADDTVESPDAADAPEATDVVADETVEAAAEEPEDEDPAVALKKQLRRQAGEWYVIHSYAGYENKVKANLESRIHTMQMEDKIFRVHIPMEDVMEIKSGKRQVVQKKVFPGYLLVKMWYDNDSWYVVRNTPGVTGFVSAGTGSKPTPLS